MLGFALVLAVGYAVKVYKPELFEGASKDTDKVTAPAATNGSGTSTPAQTAPQAPAQTTPLAPAQTNQTPTQQPKQNPPAATTDPTKAILDGRTRIDRSGGVARTMIVTPYYVDGLKNTETLVPVQILVPASQTQIKDTVTHLINPPEDLMLYSSFPKGTTVQGVNLKDGVVTVDLSPQAAQVQGSLNAQTMRATLVYSLTAIDGVKSVQLWVNGRPTPLHGMEWTKPITRAEMDATGWFKLDHVVKNTLKP